MAYGLGVTLTCNSKARDGMTFMEHQNKPFGDVETYIYIYLLNSCGRSSFWAVPKIPTRNAKLNV